MENINTPIQFIKDAEWLNELEYCPQNVDQLCFLINLIDDLGVFNGYNMKSVTLMDSKRLDIIYFVAKASNIIFDQMVTKIHNKTIDLYKQMYLSDDSFDDQIMQDTDYIVKKIIKSNVSTNIECIKNKVNKYLSSLMKTDFYQTEVIMCPNLQPDQNKKVIDEISNIIHAEIQSQQKTIKFLVATLDIVFYIDPQDKSVDDRYNLIKTNTDVLNYHISAMDVYNDYISSYDFSMDVSYHLNNMGYSVKNTKVQTNKTNMVLHPFIANNVIEKKKLKKLIKYVFEEYSSKRYIVSDCNGMTLRELYESIHSHSFDSFRESFIITGYFMDDTNALFVYKLLSSVLNINLIIFDKKFYEMRFISDNTSSPTENIIMIYMDGNMKDSLSSISSISVLSYADNKQCHINKYSRVRTITDFLDKKIKRRSILFEK